MGGGSDEIEVSQLAWSHFLFLTSYLYYIVFIIFVPGFYLAIRSLPRPTSAYNMTFGKHCTNFLSQWLGIDYEIRNEEIFNREGCFIVVANHQSVFDVISVSRMWPRNCVMVAKTSILWFTGPFGIAVWLAGALFIKRSNKKSAISSLNGAVERMKREELRVWVYAEGTRNMNGEMMPFKKGAFHMAVQAQVPIIPVVISSYRNWLDWPNFRIRGAKARKVIMKVLEPVETAGKTPEDINNLVERCFNTMEPEFKQVSREAQEKTDLYLQSCYSHHQKLQ